MINLDEVVVKREKTNRREGITGTQRLVFAYYFSSVLVIIFLIGYVGLFINESVAEKAFNTVSTLVGTLLGSISTYYFCEAKR